MQTMTKSDQGRAVAACLFHGMGDATRLGILQELARSERRVTDLVSALGVPQSTVSKHLACLRDCDLVEFTPQGRASFYRLKQPSATRDLLAAAERLLAETGESVALCQNFGVDAKANAR